MKKTFEHSHQEAMATIVQLVNAAHGGQPFPTEGILELGQYLAGVHILTGAARGALNHFGYLLERGALTHEDEECLNVLRQVLEGHDEAIASPLESLARAYMTLYKTLGNVWPGFIDEAIPEEGLEEVNLWRDRLESLPK